MKKLLLFLFLLTESVIGLAQDHGKLFYNEYWVTTRRDSAYYYRVWTKSGDNYEIHDYYNDGTPLLSGYLSSLDDNYWPNRVGHFVYFDKATARKICEGDYKSGRKNGVWKYYEADRETVATSVVFASDMRTRQVSFYSDGKTVSIDADYELGKKVKAKSYYDNGKLHNEREYANGVTRFEHCYGIGGEDTSCDKDTARYVEQMPKPSFSLGSYLGDNIHYPEVARLKGITGRVVVEFVVMEDGTISTALVSQSVYPAIDEEALRVVAAMPKWSPGRQNGKTVKVLYSQPVTFALE